MENRAFYNVTLKNFATPWTNRDQTVFAPLNDYIATVIGMVRDDVPFDRVLSDDILYIGAAAAACRPYSPSSNDHYAALEAQGVNLKDGAGRARRSRPLTGLPPEATAGVITTRAAAQAFFIAGTNRAMFRFTLINHLCRDLEQVHGHDAPAGPHPPGRQPQPGRRQPRVPQQLRRLPHRHGPAGAGLRLLRLRRDGGPARLHGRRQVRPKYFNNARHIPPPAYVTPDDRWDNYWRKGRNALLGWDPALPGAGQGAKSLGPGTRAAPMRSPAARSRRCSATSASARRATPRTGRACRR